MTGIIQIEHGSTKKILYARIRPNEDLVHSLEKLCLRAGIENAMLRGSLGSLTDAKLVTPNGETKLLRGPAVEVVSLSGEVRTVESRTPVAELRGVVCGPTGEMAGGRFVRGENPVCVTFEIALEEWVPDPKGAP